MRPRATAHMMARPVFAAPAIAKSAAGEGLSQWISVRTPSRTMVTHSGRWMISRSCPSISCPDQRHTARTAPFPRTRTNRAATSVANAMAIAPWTRAPSIVIPMRASNSLMISICTSCGWHSGRSPVSSCLKPQREMYGKDLSHRLRLRKHSSDKQPDAQSSWNIVAPNLR